MSYFTKKLMLFPGPQNDMNIYKSSNIRFIDSHPEDRMLNDRNLANPFYKKYYVYSINIFILKQRFRKAT